SPRQMGCDCADLWRRRSRLGRQDQAHPLLVLRRRQGWPHPGGEDASDDQGPQGCRGRAALLRIPLCGPQQLGPRLCHGRTLHLVAVAQVEVRGRREHRNRGPDLTAPATGELMSDRLVTVASFVFTPEAEMAKNLLEAEGIPAFIAGGLAADAF